MKPMLSTITCLVCAQAEDDCLFELEAVLLSIQLSGLLLLVEVLHSSCLLATTQWSMAGSEVGHSGEQYSWA